MEVKLRRRLPQLIIVLVRGGFLSARNTIVDQVPIKVGKLRVGRHQPVKIVVAKQVIQVPVAWDYTGILPFIRGIEIGAQTQNCDTKSPQTIPLSAIKFSHVVLNGSMLLFHATLLVSVDALCLRKIVRYRR